jgi:DNA-binding transcriptional LysR family regulator
MFGLRDAEIVREIVRAGGFRAAGQRLGLAQSAISSRIAALERKLGVELFERQGRGVRLTPVGRRFLEHADRLIEARDRIVDELSARDRLAGTLRIGVAESVVHTWLPGLLTNLRDGLPRMRFELSVDTSAELQRKLRGDEIDFAVMMSQLVPETGIGTRVGRIRIVWVAAPDMNLPDGPLSLTQLARHSIVTFPKETPPFREVERLFADPEVPVPLLHGCASLSTIAHLARAGFGIGVLPRQMAEPELREGRLRELEVVPQARLRDLEFCLAHMRGRNEALAPLVLKAVERAVREA